MPAKALLERIRTADLVSRTGHVRRIMPTFIEADGPAVPLGTLCTIACGPAGARPVVAEVTRIDREAIILSPFEDRPSTFAGATVTALSTGAQVPVGTNLMGRAIDALGQHIDGGKAIATAEFRAVVGAAADTMARVTSPQPVETGIRAIDGLLTLGVGQRIGLFAASGVGKTSLINQIARQTRADRIILCLVGERGREVEALWSRELPADMRSRATLVAATSDQSAAMRARAPQVALAQAEYWRDRGDHVLLIMDSVTRLAMALREIGLAAGEPPTVRAYTPSVFAAIPRLVERCGAIAQGGAITAIMTVLAETDELDDPICEMMKSLLDGHILLSRSLAEQGHFPAIDVPRSVSRLASGLVSAEQRRAAVAMTADLSTYEGARTMIESGIYAAGADRRIDRAISARPAILGFLKQGQDQAVALEASLKALVELERSSAQHG